MNPAEIRNLVKAGLSAEQIAVVAELLEARNEVRPTSTERVRAFRQRRMERSETFQKRDETFQETPPSPPPPSPLHPPSPAPTPGSMSAGAHTREGAGAGTKPPAIPDAVAIPLRALFGRRATTPWTAKEIAAYRRLAITATAAVADLEVFAKARASGWEYYRRDTITLLNNWQAETERASNFLCNITKNGNHNRTNRPHVTRNVEPLPADRPSLNATAVGYGQDRLEDMRGPSIDEDGNECW